MQREKSKEPQIAGAFGTISEHDDERRRGLRARILTLIAIIGPGLIVMVGDNDAGGVSTYAQAGQNFGYSLLWTLPLLIPVLIVIQEMVARLGAVTGVGHGRLIRERFGRYWGNLSIFSILILNFLIIITEFIGISLSMDYFGVRSYVSVPVAVVMLFAVTASGSFRRWERFMMLFIAVNFLIVPLVILAHPSAGAMTHAAFFPHIRGRRYLKFGAVDHLDHRHHRRAVAAVLPGVQHRGQAHLAPVAELRASGHHCRLLYRGHRRVGARRGLRGGPARRTAAPPPTPMPSALHAASTVTWDTTWARSSPCCC